MKKLLLISILGLTIIFTGCATKNNKASDDRFTTVSDIINNTTETAEEQTETETTETENTESAVIDGMPTAEYVEYTNIDLDISNMNESMTYAALCNVLNDWPNYMNKVIKLTGYFYPAYDEYIQDYCYSCVVSDQNGCCTVGLEFNTTKDMTSMPEYSLMTVTGVFDTYIEDQNTYFYLKDAKVEEVEQSQ